MIKQILWKVGILSALIALGVFGINTAYAASTPQFNQTVNAGSFAGDIVNASFETVASPAVAMVDATFSYSCETATGTLGTTTEQIYISNPNDALGGWSATIAADATTAVWDAAGAGADYDFNDASGSGCTDGADADSLGGQMTVNASGATLAVGQDADTLLTNITKGSSTAFVEGSANSVTLLTATDASDDIGDWTLQGVSISQKVPAEQPADSYTINMVITFTKV